jgi:hypothetical protein
MSTSSITVDIINVTNLTVTNVNGIPYNPPYTTNENTIMGFDAAYNLTTGFANAAIGYTALYYNTTGYENTAFGDRALGTHSLSTAVPCEIGYNTALGSHTMMLHNSGNYNVAIGSSALRGVVPSTAGVDNVNSSNIAIGTESMYSCYLSTGNVAIGRDSLKSAGAPTNNVAIGYQSMMCGGGEAPVGIAPANNTVVGYQSMRMVNSGNPNTASLNSIFGFAAAGALTTASAALTGICAIGAFAANRASSNYTVAIGYESMRLLQTGDFNTGVGYNTLRNNTIGTSSTAVGYYALRSATGSDNTAVGAQAGGLVTTGTLNTVVGAAAGQSTSGASNVSIGAASGSILRTGSDNTLVGTGADVSTSTLSGCLVLGAGAVATSSNQLVAGSTAVPLGVQLTTGAAGAANAPPATPETYLKIRLNGIDYIIPCYLP